VGPNRLSIRGDSPWIAAGGMAELSKGEKSPNWAGNTDYFDNISGNISIVQRAAFKSLLRPKTIGEFIN
jgi:hypothetical protein